jgi:hypothetical protein
MGMTKDPRPLIERVPVHDIFATDLGRIDVFESHLRLVLFAEQFETEGAPAFREVVGKVIMPRKVILPAINRVLVAVGYAPVISVPPDIKH